ncbi:MAG: hypothetical protein NT118_04685, partial [Lentisphaerae bacterium]|nr:hypothetical protein [Lentisphaerota bacterium]
MNDTLNKDHNSRKISPPEFDTVKFICTRKFQKDQNGNLVNYTEDLEALGEKLDLGSVIWLHMGGISAKNWRALMKYCGEKGYVIFDIWGYIPGQKSSAQEWYLQDFGEFSPSDEDYQELLKTVGSDNFWGYDIGEQDSRYLGIFAPHYSPTTMDRRVQYQRFFNHFAKMRKDLKNDYSVLAGSTNVHYLAKEGGCRMIGGESLQIHPNINVWHAFIRGASKEYGIPFFGNVSVFNNFGYRMPYDARVDEFGSESGRTSGPSDSMFKNVFYTLYHYGSSLMGFEHFVTEKIGNAEELTAVGAIHKEVQALAKNKRPLKMVAPVAIYMDFFQGWQAPRNAVNLELFRVWGDLPYSMGDFQIAAVFELLYPNYCDSALFKDERGFLVDTPYCDIAEVVLSDAHEGKLDNYRLIIVAGDLKLDKEQTAKLNRFMDNGGKVICDNRNLAFAHENLIRIHTPYFIEESPVSEGGYLNKSESSIEFPYVLSSQAKGVLDRELRRVAPVRIENGSAMVVVSTNETDKCQELLVINNGNTVQNLKLTPNGHKTIEVTVKPKELARFSCHFSAGLDCRPAAGTPKLNNDLAVAL